MLNTWCRARRGLTLAAVVMVAGPCASAAAAGLPSVVPASGATARYLKLRPAAIIYTGDGSGEIAGSGPTIRHAGGLRWQTDTSQSATATGKNWLDNCRPDCAGGTFTGYPVSLRAYRPRTVGGHLVFTRLALRYTGRTPSRNLAYRNMTLFFNRGEYGWSF